MTKVTASSLPNDIDQLKQLLLEQMSLREKSEKENKEIISKQEKLVTKKEKRISHLEQVIHYLKLKQYGRSSERHVGTSPQDDMFFNEAEAFAEECVEEEAISHEVHVERQSAEPKPKKTRGRRKLPEHLRRVKTYYDLDELEKTCPCGCQLTEIGEVVTEQLSIIPAEIYVIQHCRKKYACKSCRDKAPATAPLPAQPLPKSNASPELLSHIVVSKFLDGLPFYRQEKIWERLKIHLPRATQANWTIGCGGLVQSLANIMFDYIAQGNLTYIDETTVQVLNEKDKPPDSKKYFWLAVGGPPDKLVFRYHYNPSRGSGVALDLLQGFKGTVMSDDWSAYGKTCEKLQLTHIACNDHARRKFKEAADDLPENRKKIGTSKIEMGLNFYKRLYAVERKIKSFSVEEKLSIRQKESMPIWNSFIAWMEKHINDVTPKSKLGKALHYTYKLKEKLSFYCTDGTLPISNQLAENAIRPFAIARKNFLFYDSPEGAQASANLYSPMMTAKHHNLNPFYYLAYVFKHLPLAETVDDIEAFLPWRLSDEMIRQE